MTDEVLKRRVMSKRAAVSLLLTGSALAVAVSRSGISWGATWRQIGGASVELYLLAVAAYYASLVVRSLRWRVLLRNAGVDRAPLVLFQIVLASFFVNCVLPAKLGDLYRAAALRTREHVAAGRSLGTIIAERLLDLFALMGLLLVAGGIAFRERVPPEFTPYLVGGLALCLAGVSGLALLASGRGRRLHRHIPVTAVRRFEDFRAGTVGAFGSWRRVVPLSVAVWGLEGARLGLVVLALGHGADVGPAQFLLVALIAALLTTVPFLPGGLVLVEGGMVAVLTVTTSLGRESAAGVALLDRSISFASLVLIGGIAFLVLHSCPARVADRRTARSSR